MFSHVLLHRILTLLSSQHFLCFSSETQEILGFLLPHCPLFLILSCCVLLISVTSDFWHVWGCCPLLSTLTSLVLFSSIMTLNTSMWWQLPTLHFQPRVLPWSHMSNCLLDISSWMAHSHLKPDCPKPGLFFPRPSAGGNSILPGVQGKTLRVTLSHLLVFYLSTNPVANFCIYTESIHFFPLLPLLSCSI